MEGSFVESIFMSVFFYFISENKNVINFLLAVSYRGHHKVRHRFGWEQCLVIQITNFGTFRTGRRKVLLSQVLCLSHSWPQGRKPSVGSFSYLIKKIYLKKKFCFLLLIMETSIILSMPIHKIINIQIFRQDNLVVIWSRASSIL